MPFASRIVLTGVLCAGIAASAALHGLSAASPISDSTLRIDLAERLAAGKLRVVNREASSIEKIAGGVRLSAAPGGGTAWIEGTDFAQGTIEIDIRGKDVLQQSFVGIAFHRRDDTTYEAVYLRPFNFRADDPVRYRHAVQYISLPDFDWPRLRKERPEEFENPVDRSASPTGWVPVRLIICNDGRGLCRCSEGANPRGAEARQPRAWHDRPLGRQWQRRGLREPAGQSVGIGGRR